MNKEFLAVIFLWILYFIIHSLFASNTVKAYFSRKSQSLYRFYRIFYVLFATLSLLGIFLYQATLDQHYLYSRNGFSTFIGLMLATWGILIVKSAFKYYDAAEFFGIKQVKGNMKDQPFHRKGIMNLVRHPTYTGTIILLIGFLVFSPSIINMITVICMIIYIIVGIRFEERKLIKLFKEDYLKYKAEVPMLFPAVSSLINYLKGSN